MGQFCHFHGTPASYKAFTFSVVSPSVQSPHCHIGQALFVKGVVGVNVQTIDLPTSAA